MAGRIGPQAEPAAADVTRRAGLFPWLGWGCLVLALVLAVVPLPVLLLWLVPGVAATVCALLALARNAPFHGALLLTGTLVALPLAWGLGMVGLLRAADALIGGAF